MDSENVLSQGIETLFTIKENLLELEGYKEKSSELSQKEDQLDKQLQSKEKAIIDEIASTIKKRRMEVEASFDEQLEKVKTRIKKVQSKKEKEKDLQVSERIKKETTDLTAEKVRLKEEMIAVYQKNNIPRVWNNPLYHALYMPRNIKDVGAIILTILITLLLIPVGIYRLFLDEKPINLIIVYFFTVLFFGGLYLLINVKTKEKHADAAIDIRAIRAKQAKNQKKINAIIKDIRKDKDESTYSLDGFTEEIKELEKQLLDITEEKKEAMVGFETDTKTVINQEIRASHKEEIKLLKEEHDSAYAKQKEAEEKVKLYSIEVANRYETFMGKDMLNITVIDQLIQMMQSNRVATIGEAVNTYRQESSSTLVQQ